MNAVAKQCNELAHELRSFYLEREDVVLAMFLALLSRQNFFVVGPPGSAKSAIVRDLLAAIVRAKKFMIQFSKTKPPEKVLGPTDMARYRATGDVIVKDAGYITWANLVLADEVGKMSPVTGHDLLLLFNEHKKQETDPDIIDENGDPVTEHDVDFYTAFCTSNEMITNESDDAAALDDRLVVRCTADYLKNKANFGRLLTSVKPEFQTTIEWDDLKDVIDNVIPQITFSHDAVIALIQLRERFFAENIAISERRWMQSREVLKANAFLQGRDQVEEEDLEVLRFTLWMLPEQIERVEHLCNAASNPFVDELVALKAVMKEITTEMQVKINDGDDLQMVTYGKDANNKLKGIRERMDNLMRQSAKPIPGFRNAAEMHLALQADVFEKLMGNDIDTALVAAGKRNGLGNGDDFWGV